MVSSGANCLGQAFKRENGPTACLIDDPILMQLQAFGRATTFFRSPGQQVGFEFQGRQPCRLSADQGLPFPYGAVVLRSEEGIAGNQFDHPGR